jgi:hypothetical protein
MHFLKPPSIRQYCAATDQLEKSVSLVLFLLLHGLKVDRIMQGFGSVPTNILKSRLTLTV